MSEKHLATGDENPAQESGVLRLYSMKYCPFAQRPRLVLAHKKVPYETVNVNLKKKPSWLFEKNPGGLVPVTEIDGRVLYESLIVCDWLDEAYPQNPLHPKDPHEKGKQRILIDASGKAVSAFYGYLRGAEDAKAELLEKYYVIQDTFEAALSADFFGGAAVSMLDLMIWPWYERLASVKMTLPRDRFPRLNEWMVRMRTVPAVVEVLISDEQHAFLFNEYVTRGNEVRYDHFLEQKQADGSKET